jgi:hypothetical protein
MEAILSDLPRTPARNTNERMITRNWPAECTLTKCSTRTVIGVCMIDELAEDSLVQIIVHAWCCDAGAPLYATVARSWWAASKRVPDLVRATDVAVAADAGIGWGHPALLRLDRGALQREGARHAAPA